MRRPYRWIEKPNAGELFMQSVQKADDNGCWLWMGARDRDGYGRVAVNRKLRRAARVAYGLFVGPIEKGLLVMHLCDNPPCVRPDHLRLGTASENITDAVRKGRLQPRWWPRRKTPRHPPRRTRKHRPPGWIKQPNAQQLFLRQVQKTDNCWMWLGPTKPSGHGCLTADCLCQSAHRIAYRLFKAPIEKGKHIRHKCDNPPCVNPDHLLIGTHQDNMRDATERGRWQTGDQHWSRRMPEKVARGERHHSHTKPGCMPSGDEHWTHRNREKARRNIQYIRGHELRGSKHHQAKLTEEIVTKLRKRAAQGAFFGHLAKEFAVSRSVIRDAVTGATWAHVPGPLPKRQPCGAASV